MTARMWRRARRRKPNHVSDILATIWGYGTTDLGSFTAHLLGKNWVREVVPVALLLKEPPAGTI